MVPEPLGIGPLSISGYTFFYGLGLILAGFLTLKKSRPASLNA